MAFRPAEPDDVNSLTSLMGQSYAADRYAFVEEEARTAFARLLADPSLGTVWLAQEAAEPVGYVPGNHEFSTPSWRSR